jgi:hypothetical protein
MNLGPDPELGAALRAALEPREHQAFIARVLAAYPASPARAWEILAGWAWRGIAAAMLLAGLAGYLVAGPLAGADPAPGDPLPDIAGADAGPAAALAGGDGPPDPGVLFASIVEP